MQVLRIEPLGHRDAAVAQAIHRVLIVAYTQEAELLGLKHLAPLDRTVEDIQSSDEYFLGAFREDELVGALSIGRDDEPDQINVATLVVHPNHQRCGVGKALMLEALRRGEGMVFSVSTGAKNTPALGLYRGLGFVPYRFGTIGAENLALVKLRKSVPQAVVPASRRLAPEGISMPNLRAVEIKAFVPARDFELSKRFYQDIGFTLASDSGSAVYFHHGDVSFLLQDFYVEAMANNFMMHLLVEDVDAWHAQLEAAGIAGTYGVKLGSIETQAWRMRDFVLFDPSGVLWRIAQNTD